MCLLQPCIQGQRHRGLVHRCMAACLHLHAAGLFAMSWSVSRHLHVWGSPECHDLCYLPSCCCAGLLLSSLSLHNPFRTNGCIAVASSKIKQADKPCCKPSGDTAIAAKTWRKLPGHCPPPPTPPPFFLPPPLRAPPPPPPLGRPTPLCAISHSTPHW